MPSNLKLYAKRITSTLAPLEDYEYDSTVLDFEIGYSTAPTNISWATRVPTTGSSQGTILSDFFDGITTETRFGLFSDAECTNDTGLQLIRNSNGTVVLYSKMNGAEVTAPLDNTDTWFDIPVSLSEYTLDNIANACVNGWENAFNAWRKYGMDSIEALNENEYHCPPLILLRDTEDPDSYGVWTQNCWGNLFTGYNWYTFFTGTFKIPTFYIETEDGHRIYLGKTPDSEFMGSTTYFRDYIGNQDAQDLYSDGYTPNVCWNYQSGSPISDLFSQMGDYVTLKSGGVIALEQGDWGPLKYIILYRQQQKLKMLIGHWTDNGDLSGWGPIWKRAANGQTETNYHAPCLMLNPIYNASVNDVLDAAPAGDYTRFDDKGVIRPMIPYHNNYYDSGTDYAKDDWGFSTNWVTPVICDVVTSKSLSNMQFNTLISYEIDEPDFSGVENSIETAEQWKIILGISEGVEPVEPEHGSGSIGGGGKTGGGHGDFDDSGDNIDFDSSPTSLGYTDTLTNWYLGVADPTVDTNPTDVLDKLGDWLKETLDPDAQNPLAGLGYKYEDKMRNLVSLKVVYAPFAPAVSGPLVIKIHGQVVHGSGQGNPIGYKVTNQFRRDNLKVNFTLPEYFGSFLDYSPYTRVQIYLPFSGTYDLNPVDIIGKSSTLMCSIDWITGDITYQIRVNDGNTNSVLYTFTGNSSYEIPLTSTDYGGKVQSLIAAGMGVIGAGVGLYTGNAAMVAGALPAIASGMANISEKGKTQSRAAMSGVAGGMCVRHPYLIVTRPKQIVADDYGSTYGWPSMQSKKLSSLTGFVKVAECHWEGLGTATEDEIAEIDRIMKSGAIL